MRVARPSIGWKAAAGFGLALLVLAAVAAVDDFSTSRMFTQALADDPDRQCRLESLPALVTRHPEFLEHALALRDGQGAAAAARLIETDADNDTMEAITTLIQALEVRLDDALDRVDAGSV